MPDPLLISVAKADIGRRLDQLLLVLVVVAIAVAWLTDPGQPLRFIAFAILLGMSWLVPRALNGSRRNAACSPGSLCATARIQYRQPVALHIHEDGSLFVQWVPEGPWHAAQQVRALWLGPLLQLAVSTAAPSEQPSPSTGFPSRSLESGSVSGASSSMAATAQKAHMADPAVPFPQAPAQRGSCLLWLPRLGAARAAAVRRWLVWRRRGGHAPGQMA